MKTVHPKETRLMHYFIFLADSYETVPSVKYLKKTMRMKRILIFLFSIPAILSLKAQDSTLDSKDPALEIYRASFPHINDLVHTKLSVRFDYTRSYLYGKAWITLQPHFYPTDSLTLDAKGMEIKEVSMNQRESTNSAEV